jgi:UDP-galactopyranose mutase
VSRAILFYSDFPFGYHNREAEEKMARFAARGYRVHYVEQLGIRNPRPRHLVRFIRKLKPGGRSRRAAAPFHVIAPKLLPPRRVPIVDAFNRHWLARQLLRHLDVPSETIFWVRYPTPELVPLVESARWRLVVYECVDDHERSPGMTPRLAAAFRAAENRVLQAARLVFVSSEAMYERLATRHPNVVLAPHAVDLDAFAAYSAPPNGRHVATYVGALDFRFDSGLLARVAEQLPDWTFMIAGPARDGADRPLAHLGNVRLLGRVDPSKIPAVLGEASVCLMPYRRGAFADTLFPIKLVEYLAAGKPIVSTSIRTSREFEDVVTLADDAVAFAHAIETSVGADSAGARRVRVERARPFSWDRRIDAMEEAIEAAIRRA